MRTTALVSQVIDLLEADMETRLPLYACRISAGFPLPADDYLEDEVSFTIIVGRSLIDAESCDHLRTQLVRIRTQVRYLTLQIRCFLSTYIRCIHPYII